MDEYHKKQMDEAVKEAEKECNTNLWIEEINKGNIAVSITEGLRSQPLWDYPIEESIARVEGMAYGCRAIKDKRLKLKRFLDMIDASLPDNAQIIAETKAELKKMGD